MATQTLTLVIGAILMTVYVAWYFWFLNAAERLPQDRSALIRFVALQVVVLTAISMAGLGAVIYVNAPELLTFVLIGLSLFAPLEAIPLTAFAMAARKRGLRRADSQRASG